MSSTRATTIPPSPLQLDADLDRFLRRYIRVEASRMFLGPIRQREAGAPAAQIQSAGLLATGLEGCGRPSARGIVKACGLACHATC
jgi:hypothetical protein